MDYPFTACLITAILSAWLGAYVCYSIGKQHYRRAEFWIEQMKTFWGEVDNWNREAQRLLKERNDAQFEIGRLRQALGQAIMNRDEAVEAVKVLLTERQVQTPTADDTLAWKALLLACEELTQRSVEGRAQTTVEGWTDFFLNGAANGSAPG